MIAPCNKFLFRQVPIKSRADEISVVEENSNLSHESSAFLSSMCGFKLASSKIASLLKHINELRVLLCDNPLDILSINETRLDDSVGDDEVYILVTISLATIVNITVDLVGEFASMFNLM